MKTPVGITELKSYVVVYEPPPPHVCKKPAVDELREKSIIECLECGQRWKLQVGRVRDSWEDSLIWFRTRESAPALEVS